MQRRTNRAGILGLSLAVALTTAGLVRAEASAEPTTAELMKQIDALRAKIESLEQKSVNQADVDATMKQVLADAEKRSQLIQAEGFTAGYSKGAFVLQSADGKFRLQPFFQYQVRHDTTWRENGKERSAGGSSEDDTQNGWELRRMKFGFKGNVYVPELTYNFLWQTNRKDGGVALEEAFLTYNFAHDWGFRIGQFKDPLYKESLVSSTRLLAAERSLLADQLFGGDNYVQGVSLIYGDKGPIHATATYHDGFASANTNFQDPGTPGATLTNASGAGTNTTDFGIASRVEYLAFGDWKGGDDFTALKVPANTLIFGAAVDATQSGDVTAYRHTADALFKTTGGLALYAAFGGNYSTEVGFGSGPTAFTDDTYTWGAVGQIAYLIPDTKWEPFARYTFINYDEDTVASPFSNETSEITVGVNYYFAGHAAKFTLDLGYLPNGSVTNSDSGDVLINADNEVYIRGQFQLLL